MKIETSREALLGALSTVSGAVLSAGNVIQIWQNVLLTVKGNTLIFIAANQEMQIKTTCEAKNSGEFSTTVSATKLRDILTKLPLQSSVKMIFSKDKVKISAFNSVFNLSTLDASDFPQLGSSIENKEKMTPLSVVAAGNLLHTLRYVQYACASQSHRMSLNGILLDMTVNGVWLVATDGHRLALERLSESTNKEEIKVIIPRKSASELVRNLSAIEAETPVEIYTNQSLVRFNASSFELISTLIDETFPEYKEIIPHNNEKIVKIIDRECFCAALDLVSVMGDKGATVIFNLTKGKLQVSCTGQEQDMGKDVIDVDYEGEDLEMGFNVSFLLEMLKRINDNVIFMRISDVSSSVLFHPADESCTFRYVVMPIRL